MRIRLVATDLDGTFFGPDHRPEQRTVSALNAVHAAGVICVAVTGRSHMDGARLATSTGAEFDWFIGSNGGHRLNLRTDEMEERLLFADGLVERLRDDLLRALPDLASDTSPMTVSCGSRPSSICTRPGSAVPREGCTRPPRRFRTRSASSSSPIRTSTNATSSRSWSPSCPTTSI